MTYHIIDPEEIEPMDDRPAEVLPIGEAAGLNRREDKMGLRLYRAEPGQQLPLVYHYHDEQVEAFYVIEGRLHVETPEEEYIVDTDQTFIVEPGNPHRAFVPEDAATAAHVLAIGAPSTDDAHAYEPEE